MSQFSAKREMLPAGWLEHAELGPHGIELAGDEGNCTPQRGDDLAVEAELRPVGRVLEIGEDGQLASPSRSTYAQPSGDPYEEQMERCPEPPEGEW